MTWIVKHHPDLRIIETGYAGDLTSIELNAAVSETIRLSRAHGTTLFLADCTELAGSHSLTDLFNVGTKLVPQDVARSMKEAILLPSQPASAEKVNFWQTVCYNRGIRVETFRDRESAIEWLVT